MSALWAILIVAAPVRVTAQDLAGTVEAGAELSSVPSPAFFVGGSFAGAGNREARWMELASRVSFQEGGVQLDVRFAPDAVAFAFDAAVLTIEPERGALLRLVDVHADRDIRLGVISDFAVPLGGLGHRSRPLPGGAGVRLGIDVDAPGLRMAQRGWLSDAGLPNPATEVVTYWGLHVLGLASRVDVRWRLGPATGLELSLRGDAAMALFDDGLLLGHADAIAELGVVFTAHGSDLGVFVAPSLQARAWTGERVRAHGSVHLGLRAAFPGSPE